MSDHPHPDDAEQAAQGSGEAAESGDQGERDGAPPTREMHRFEDRPPVTIDAPPMPSFEETRVTEALADKRRLKRQLKRARRKAHVMVRRTGAPPAKVNMDRDVLVFGRDPADCDIVLDGPVVSRMHARIERDSTGYFTLMDCKSRNGTYVDGRPVKSMNLVDGDRFEIGETEIEFHVED